MGGLQCNQLTTSGLVGLHRGMALYEELSVVPLGTLVVPFGVAGHSAVAVASPTVCQEDIKFPS